MEAWDVVILGDGPAALSAAAQASKDGASVLMMSSTALATLAWMPWMALHVTFKKKAIEAIARTQSRWAPSLVTKTSLLNKRPRLCELLIFSSEEVPISAEMQKGLSKDIMHLGIQKPRLINAGDSTTREIQQVLEEQCMKHGVTRRGDQVPLELIHTDFSVNGLIAIDMLNGRLLSIQCKALIIADGGFEGAFTNGSTSLGMDLAYRAGAPLRNMEFIAETPLGVVGTNLIIPQSILSDGATLHTPSGTALETSSTTPTSEICAKMHEAGTTVLDARNLGEHAAWWSVLFDNIKQRTGIDMRTHRRSKSHQLQHTPSEDCLPMNMEWFFNHGHDGSRGFTLQAQHHLAASMALTFLRQSP